MESHRRGDATEAVVVAELKRRTIPVALPFGDNERYDAVVETPDGALLKLQIKTGWTTDGSVRFNTKTQHTNADGHVYKPYEDDVDHFVVYSPDTEEMYLLGEEEVGRNMWLRVEEPDQPDRKINWASDYEFDQRWPPGDDELEGDEVERRCRATLEATGTPFVSAPEETSYEFLVTPPDDALRATVTPGWVTEGRVRFNPSADYSEDAVDLILVWCEETDSVYLVESDEFETSISLRVSEPERERPDTTRAETYELQNRWEEVVAER